MSRSIKANINPEILKWARKSARLNLELVSKKTHFKLETLEKWENGNDKPTLNQLRTLGKIYKRPIAVFYLNEPPIDFQPMKDFRRFPEEFATNETPELIYEIRRARYQRDIAIELFKELREDIQTLRLKADLKDDPEILALRIRDRLNVVLKEQFKLEAGYPTLNYWKSAVENAGMFVFQASGINLAEMRGFSISESPLPVIVLNNKDAPNGRIFTLMHELSHIVLKEGGLCDLSESNLPYYKKNMEIFCNRVAGAILVPKPQFLSEDLIIEAPKDSFVEHDIYRLSRKYGVSKDVILRRLLIFDRIGKEFYESRMAAYLKERIAVNKEDQEDDLKIPQYVKVTSRLGRKFTSLVLTSFYHDVITLSKLTSILNTKVSHLRKIESQIMGHSVVFGA